MDGRLPAWTRERRRSVARQYPSSARSRLTGRVCVTALPTYMYIQYLSRGSGPPASRSASTADTGLGRLERRLSAGTGVRESLSECVSAAPSGRRHDPSDIRSRINSSDKKSLLSLACYVQYD